MPGHKAEVHAKAIEKLLPVARAGKLTSRDRKRGNAPIPLAQASRVPWTLLLKKARLCSGDPHTSKLLSTGAHLQD